MNFFAVSGPRRVTLNKNDAPFGTDGNTLSSLRDADQVFTFFLITLLTYLFTQAHRAVHTKSLQSLAIAPNASNQLLGAAALHPK